MAMTFEIERLYHRRRDIHAVYGGQQQGGIATPPGAPYIFIFTGEAGTQHGYSDGYEDNGVFIYTGEGQRGDMQFIRGNRAIRDHTENGKTLLLFASTKTKGIYRYKGAFLCAGYDDTQYGPDTDGHNRKLIRFQLVPTSALANQGPSSDSDSESNNDRTTDILELRKRAFDAAIPQPSANALTSKRTLYKRSQAVRRYVLIRANGICECCGLPAPFKKKNGEPYLEPHHIRQLSDDGLDSPLWVAGICPTCHREIHHGQNGPIKNEALIERVRRIEHSSEGLHPGE
jgi:5-methylcytosine-specific restriction protein A